MSRYKSEVLSILRVVTFKLFISLWTICCLVFILIYQHYNYKASKRKQQIMQNYYNMILELTLNKINYLAAKKSVNLQAGDSIVEIDDKSIKICQETKCSYYDLFKLCASINKIVPEFINSKISLNKSNLYINSKTQNYEIEKIHHISNSIQLAISLGIDHTFWQNKEFNIKKRFYLLSLAVVVVLLLFHLLLQLILRYSNKLYDARHHKILEQLKTEYQQQLKNRETLLMEKIWNINFNKQKDTEINYLFAQKANQVVYGNQDEFKNLTKHVPYKIILYQQDHQEKVDVDKLVDTFISRFSGEAQNISINVSIAKAR